MALFKKVDDTFSVLPNHIGIIMDGNGRWAKKRALPRSAGHKAGANVFKQISKECGRLEIPFVTFYAFSTENWKRPKEEVDALMKLFKDYLLDAEKNFSETDNLQLKFIGEKEGLSDELLELMERSEEKTKVHTGTVVNFAINYGGRQEIVHAVHELAKSGKNMLEINEDDISEHLYTKGQFDPDIIIRPSGEQRLSNFLLWQAAYSEFWYSDVLWPDFKVSDLHRCLHDYEKRNRRFGASE